MTRHCIVRSAPCETRYAGQVPKARCAGSAFSKFGRNEIDIALVNAAVMIELSDDGKVDTLRIAVGQTSSMPELITDASDQAQGAVFSVNQIDKVAAYASEHIKARSDFRASADYRRHLTRILVGRSLLEVTRKAGLALED